MDDKDLKQRLSDAVAGSFAFCLHPQEYRVVTSVVVEFFAALNLTHAEVVEVLARADGMDADTDGCIDDIKEAFCD